MSKRSTNDLFVYREPLVAVNAVTKVIPNGLAREARNRTRVGAYGGPDRYQKGVYDSIQLEWAIFIVMLGGTAEAQELLSLLG